MQRAVTLALIPVVSMLLAACATQPALGSSEAPGFWLGLLHGAIAPFSLIASLFYDVRIYAYPNSGWSYDAGFFSVLREPRAVASSTLHHQLRPFEHVAGKQKIANRDDAVAAPPQENEIGRMRG